MLCAVAIGLTACSGSTSSGSTGSAAGGPSLPASKPDPSLAANFTTAEYAEPPQSLVDAAKKEGGELTWYESASAAQIAPVLKAFEAAYPFVKVNHVSLLATAVSSRLAQEAAAHKATADVVSAGTSTLAPLIDKGLLQKMDWATAGIHGAIAPNEYEVVYSAPTYPVAYNSNLVKPADVPKKWTDLLKPEWKDGKICLWAHQTMIPNFIPAWGVERTEKFFDDLLDQNPIALADNKCAERVGAGSALLGFGNSQDAEQTIATGAPVKLAYLDPTPTDTLVSGVPSQAKHPNTAALLISWLVTKEGSTMYEDSVFKGNPMLPDTKLHKSLGQVTTTAFGFTPEAIDEYSKYTKQMSDALTK